MAGRLFSPDTPVSSTNKRYNRNSVESGVKHQKTLNGIFLLQLLVLKNVIPEHMVLIVHFIVGVITNRVIVSQVYVSVILGIQDNTVNW